MRFPNLPIRNKGKKNNQVQSVLVASEEYFKVSTNGPYTFGLSSDEQTYFGLGEGVPEVSPE